MSGYLSTELARLEEVLQAEPLSMRRVSLPTASKGGALAAEHDTGLESESPRGYAYDIELGEGASEPLTDLQFNQQVRIDVYVVAPIVQDTHRLDQIRTLSDVGEDVRSRVLTASGLDAKAEGLHSIRRDAARQLWILIVPFSLRYEEDATAD